MLRKRLDQFVDAAFGFAVTLLVISGAQPENLKDLQAALRNIPACRPTASCPSCANARTIRGSWAFSSTPS